MATGKPQTEPHPFPELAEFEPKRIVSSVQMLEPLAQSTPFPCERRIIRQCGMSLALISSVT
jgi:hypothetical protein